jgi:hypothetical protein
MIVHSSTLRSFSFPTFLSARDTNPLGSLNYVSRNFKAIGDGPRNDNDDESESDWERLQSFRSLSVSSVSSVRCILLPS